MLDSPAIAGFLDPDYYYKLVGTQILPDTEWAQFHTLAKILSPLGIK